MRRNCRRAWSVVRRRTSPPGEGFAAPKLDSRCLSLRVDVPFAEVPVGLSLFVAHPLKPFVELAVGIPGSWHLDHRLLAAGTGVEGLGLPVGGEQMDQSLTGGHPRFSIGAAIFIFGRSQSIAARRLWTPLMILLSCFVN